MSEVTGTGAAMICDATAVEAGGACTIALDPAGRASAVPAGAMIPRLPAAAFAAALAVAADALALAIDDACVLLVLDSRRGAGSSAG